MFVLDSYNTFSCCLYFYDCGFSPVGEVGGPVRRGRQGPLGSNTKDILKQRLIYC
jgi:hypothetical protein